MRVTIKLLSSLTTIAKGRMPPQVVLQFTDHCQAMCPQCGMRASEKFSRSRLSVDDGKRLIDHAAAQGVRFLSFTGGEPLLFADDLITLIDHAGRAGIEYIRTGTNGFLLRHTGKLDWTDTVHRLAEKLARTKLYTFWISIDSARAEVHETIRGMQGLIKGIEQAIPIFHSYGLYPSANLGINRMLGGSRLNLSPETPAKNRRLVRQAFTAFYTFVEQLGFTIVNACYPMSSEEDTLGNIYRATSSNDIVSFSRQEKALLFSTLSEVIPEYRSRLRIFTPRSSLHALARENATGHTATYPCHGGEDFFFVDAAGCNAFPCGYRGQHNLGKFWDLELGAGRPSPFCRDCDWECFRDPSQLYGPAIDLTRRPHRFVKGLLRDRKGLGLWLNDIRYLRDCDAFCGRLPPNHRKLAKWAVPARHWSGRDIVRSQGKLDTARHYE